MCGISAIISCKQISERELLAMNKQIKHRGPDDEGYVFFNNDRRAFIFAGEDTPDEVLENIDDHAYLPSALWNENVLSASNVGLGHRRLSILDLSPTGHMPMCTLDQRYWITYNGEVYNYLEIKKELELFGCIFYTQTDTEVILKAYEYWGKSCLDKFIGMWAFIIYDTKKGIIFGARDRYGIKPLYYWAGKQDIYFASEIKQFTAISGWKSNINGSRIAEYLLYSMANHTNETMFDGVFQILPGEMFEFKNEDVNSQNFKSYISKWYKPDQKHTFKGTKNQAYMEFKRLFQESVKLHLRADVAVGTSLSGGLDSSAVAMEVNRILKDENKSNLQKTFSAGSVVPKFDESEWAKKVVSEGGMDAHFITPNMDDLIKDIDKIVWQFDEPFQSLSPFLAYNIFKKAKSENVTVLLNGQGADEFLGGYGHFTPFVYISLLKSFDFSGFFRLLKTQKNERNVSYKESVYKIIHALLPDYIRDKLSALNNKNNALSMHINLDMLSYDIKQSPNSKIPVGLGSRENVCEYYTFYNPLPKYLAWEDRNSMAHSVEARVPFLNHQIIEFVNSLPIKFLESEGIRKQILREGLSEILPVEIKDRKDKIGYETAEEEWMKKTHTQWFRDKIIESINNSNGIINSSVLDSFDDMVKGKISFSFFYWRVIMLGQWIKTYNVGL